MAARPNDPSPAQLRVKSDQLLKAAAAALAAPLAKAGAFKDAGTFKASLIKGLAGHPGFDRHARDLHALHLAGRNHAPRGASQIPVKLQAGGRPQAPRHEASQGLVQGRPRRRDR